MASDTIINNCNTKMKKAFDVFKNDLGSLRTGRANAAMLDIVKVEVYGQKSYNGVAIISKMVLLLIFSITLLGNLSELNRAWTIAVMLIFFTIA